MKLFDKIKNVLFEEEEVEIPVISSSDNKIVKKEEITEIVKEKPVEKLKEDFELPKKKLEEDEDLERNLYKSEPTFKFPLAFDEEIEEPKLRTSKNIFEPEKKKIPERKIDFGKYDSLESKKEERTFKPSPIISPIYGILDQNYKKEDIVEKGLNKHKEDNLEKARKKAFGEKPKEEVIETEIEPEEDIKGKTIEELLEDTDLEISEETIEIEENITPKEAIDTYKALDKIEEEINEASNVSKNKIEDTLESDLFDLIDSMYENREESEE